jgi:FMN reductase
MQIAVVTGNPKPASRTQSVALALADLLAAELPGEPKAPLVIDLAEHASSLFDWSDAELSRLTAEVAAADLAIFASPPWTPPSPRGPSPPSP